ncbi:DUF2513 domain-containing protein [Vibrio neptunius]|uniref:DUF2513 domain-containing protein n=1 Tax=Vibrio neptunius TaxID=170651 RepID=UPI003CE48735
MKRDMELIRSLLLAIEENAHDYKLQNYNLDAVRYHEALLIEAGLVVGSISQELGTTEYPYVKIFKLTWSGHEFIDNIREDRLWSTIKCNFKEASFSTIMNVSKELAEGYAKKKVKELLN